MVDVGKITLGLEIHGADLSQKLALKIREAVEPAIKEVNAQLATLNRDLRELDTTKFDTLARKGRDFRDVLASVHTQISVLNHDLRDIDTTKFDTLTRKTGEFGTAIRVVTTQLRAFDHDIRDIDTTKFDAIAGKVRGSVAPAVQDADKQVTDLTRDIRGIDTTKFDTLADKVRTRVEPALRDARTRIHELDADIRNIDVGRFDVLAAHVRDAADRLGTARTRVGEIGRDIRELDIDKFDALARKAAEAAAAIHLTGDAGKDAAREIKVAIDSTILDYDRLSLAAERSAARQVVAAQAAAAANREVAASIRHPAPPGTVEGGMYGGRGWLDRIFGGRGGPPGGGGGGRGDGRDWFGAASGRGGGGRGVLGALHDVTFGLPGAAFAAGNLPVLGLGVVNLVGALEQLSKIVLLIPGGMSGMLASLGTAKLGFSGMAEAVGAAAAALKSGDWSDANEKLAKMAPNAAAVAKAIAQAITPLEDIRKIVAQNIFAGLDVDAKAAIGALVPTLRTGANQISQAWNATLKALVGAVGAPTTQTLLGRVFGDTAQAQRIGAAGIAPLVHAMGVLSAAGADTLPRLAYAINDVINRFDRFITLSEKTGDLNRWINQAMTGFKHLGDSIINILKIFHDLTTAAGGSGFLAWLDKTTARLHAFLSSTRGQNDLKQFFADGRHLIAEWEPILRDLATRVLPGVWDACRQWSDILLPFLRAATNLLTSMPGIIKPLVLGFLAFKTINAFGGLLSGLGGLNRGLDDANTKVGVLSRTLGGLKGLAGTVGLGAILSGLPNPPLLGGSLTPAGQIGQRPGSSTAEIIGGGAAVGGSIAGIPGAIGGAGLGAVIDAFRRRQLSEQQRAQAAQAYAAAPDQEAKNAILYSIFGGPQGVAGLHPGTLDYAFLNQIITGLYSESAPRQTEQRRALQDVIDTAKTATRAVEELGGAVEKLPNGEIRIKDPTPEIMDRLDHLGLKVKSLPDGTITIYADTDTARRQIDSFIDEYEHAVINVPVVPKGAPPGTPLGPGQYVPPAPGGAPVPLYPGGPTIGGQPGVPGPPPGAPMPAPPPVPPGMGPVTPEPPGGFVPPGMESVTPTPIGGFVPPGMESQPPQWAPIPELPQAAAPMPTAPSIPDEQLGDIRSLLSGQQGGPLTQIADSTRGLLDQTQTSARYPGIPEGFEPTGQLGPFGTPIVRPIPEAQGGPNIGYNMAAAALQALGFNPNAIIGVNPQTYNAYQRAAAGGTGFSALGGATGPAPGPAPTPDLSRYIRALSSFAQTGNYTPELASLGIQPDDPILRQIMSSASKKTGALSSDDISQIISQVLGPGGYTGPLTTVNEPLISALQGLRNQAAAAAPTAAGGGGALPGATLPSVPGAAAPGAATPGTVPAAGANVVPVYVTNWPLSTLTLPGAAAGAAGGTGWTPLGGATGAPPGPPPGGGPAAGTSGWFAPVGGGVPGVTLAGFFAGSIPAAGGRTTFPPGSTDYLPTWASGQTGPHYMGPYAPSMTPGPLPDSGRAGGLNPLDPGINDWWRWANPNGPGIVTRFPGSDTYNSIIQQAGMSGLTGGGGGGAGVMFTGAYRPGGAFGLGPASVTGIVPVYVTNWPLSQLVAPTQTNAGGTGWSPMGGLTGRLPGPPGVGVPPGLMPAGPLAGGGGVAGGPPGSSAWLSGQLSAAGLSPDEIRGILAMNIVEGGATSPKSLLGFTEGQAQGPEAHVQAFLKQWNDLSRRGPGGMIPGVSPGGQVIDPGTYLTWIREKIVGQTGVARDWQGNTQPPAGVYQSRLQQAWDSLAGAGGGVLPGLPTMPAGFAGAGPPLGALPGEYGLQPNTAALRRTLFSQFPQISDIGGYRPTDPYEWHPSGRGLDVSIPGWDTPGGKALGDQIFAWLQQYGPQYGVRLQNTLWQQPEHYNHIHVSLAPSGPQAFFAGAGGPGQTTSGGEGPIPGGMGPWPPAVPAGYGPDQPGGPSVPGVPGAPGGGWPGMRPWSPLGAGGGYGQPVPVYVVNWPGLSSAPQPPPGTPPAVNQTPAGGAPPSTFAPSGAVGAGLSQLVSPVTGAVGNVIANVGGNILTAASSTFGQRLPPSVAAAPAATPAQLAREGNPLALLAAAGYTVPNLGVAGGQTPTSAMTAPSQEFNAQGQLYASNLMFTQRTYTDLASIMEAFKDQSIAATNAVQKQLTAEVLVPIFKTAVTTGMSAITDATLTSWGTAMGQAAAPPIAKAVSAANAQNAAQAGTTSYNPNTWDTENSSAASNLVNTPVAAADALVGSFDTGGLWAPGTYGVNVSGSVERVLDPVQTVLYDRGMLPIGGGQQATNVSGPLSSQANALVGAQFFGVTQIPILGEIINIIVSILLAVIGVSVQVANTLQNVSTSFEQFRGTFQEFTATGQLFANTAMLVDRSRTSMNEVAQQRLQILEQVISALIQYIINNVIIPIAEAIGQALVSAAGSAAGAAIGASGFGLGSQVGGSAANAFIDALGDAGVNIAGQIGGQIADAFVSALVPAIGGIIGSSGLGTTFLGGAGLGGITGAGGLLGDLVGTGIGVLATLFASALSILPLVGSGFDSGGVAMTAGLLPKATVLPERVLSPHQTSLFERMVTALETGNMGGSTSTTTIHAPFTVTGGTQGGQIAHDRLLALMS
jgi:hypothetical protein